MKPPSPRRRGGQPGNTNAVTHGLYSAHLKNAILAKVWASAAPASPAGQSPAEGQLARSIDEEIELLRAFLRRVIDTGVAEELTLRQSLTLLRCICAATSNVNSLVKTRQILTTFLPLDPASIARILIELKDPSAGAGKNPG